MNWMLESCLMVISLILLRILMLIKLYWIILLTETININDIDGVLVFLILKNV